MRAPVAAVLLAFTASGAAFAGHAEFDRIVRAIESHYGTRPLHIPFMGVANFVVNVTRPEGASGVKLAIFEGLKEPQSPEEPAAWRERDRFMDSLTGPDLRPLVRVHSRRDREATYIFAGPASKSGNSTRVLIATFERDEATVIEVKTNFERLFRSLQDPERAGHTLSNR